MRLSSHLTAARLALALTLLGASACSSGTASSAPESATPTFDGRRAWADLEKVVGFGPRPPASAALERTREFLEQELGKLGLDPVRESFEDDTPIGRVTFTNLWADLPGSGGADSGAVVYVASHYDTKLFRSKTFVGANDGGSSTAAVLEIARAMVAAGPRPVTYRFIWFDGEEPFRKDWLDPDNTYGSRYHAGKLAEDEALHARVAAFVLLDMVADKHLRIWRDTHSDQGLLRTFRNAAVREGLGDYITGPASPVQDDHLPFRRIGIRVLDLIDLDYGPQSRNNDWWHTPADTLENCSLASLQIAGRIALAGLVALEAQLQKQR